MVWQRAINLADISFRNSSPVASKGSICAIEATFRMGVNSTIDDILNLEETQAIWWVKAQYVPWGIIENNVLNLEETQAIWRVKAQREQGVNPCRWRRWSCWGIIAVLAGEYCRSAGDPSRCVFPVWDAVPNWATDSQAMCYKSMNSTRKVNSNNQQANTVSYEQKHWILC